MMFITHLSFALLLGLLVIRFTSLSVNNFYFLAFILIGSFLPDIDSANALIGKKIKPLSSFLMHRGFIHSMLVMVLFTVIVMLVTQNPGCALGFMLGFLSHLILDGLTITGIAFFWPSQLRVRGKLRTGGLLEWILLVVFVLGNTWLLL